MRNNLIDKINQRLAEYPRLGRALDNEALEEGLRWCYSCSCLKTVENFHKDRGRLDSKCKTCKSAAAKARHKDRPKPLKEPRYPVSVKRCPGCEKHKAWSEFSMNSGSWSGLESRCRSCRSGYYEQHKAEYHERTNEYRRYRNPWADRLSSGYRRAIEAGAYAEKVTTKELLEHWEAVGIDPNQSVYSGARLGPGRWSLDHVIPLSDPNGPGHVTSNLVPSLVHENSKKANQHFVVYLGEVHAEK
ncbi:hypothetical protein HMPREF2565_13005 [Corynebacterium sp. HMSC072A04]|nr:hypothetical protein HMPREF2565_13005 [Corynebacterium sp. HMSC072A04]